MYVSPLLHRETRNKGDAEMTDFSRLFFWRKLYAISWKQTTCLSRLVETTVCRATISRSTILKLLSYI